LKVSNFADVVASVLSRLGLQGVNRLGFSVMKRLVGDDIEVTVDDLTLAGTFAHRRYLMWLAQDRCEPYTAELYKRALAPRMTAVDVGAFVGYYTLLAAREAGPNGKVYALEPDARNHAALLKNLAANGLEGPVRAMSVVAADRAGSVQFHEDKWDPTQSSVSGYRPDGTPLTRPTCRLDEILRQEEQVDLIKIDVEGHELAVLRGLEETIGRFRERGLKMFIECNPTALAAAGESADGLLTWLEEHQVRCEAIDEKRRVLTSDLGILEEELYVNLHCTLK
jgi:FkbM family methyltransferase